MRIRRLSRLGILRPLRIRDFALLWAGAMVSLAGDGVYVVALAWQVYEISNSPGALSLVGVAWTLKTRRASPRSSSTTSASYPRSRTARSTVRRSSPILTSTRLSP